MSAISHSPEPRGLLITLEGTEGAGKSTQVPRVARRLEAAGRRVRCLREPGGTPLGEEIRQTLKHSAAGNAMTAEAELLLMNAARAQLVREVIRPALAAGEVVVCDRYLHSTLAYQGWGRGLDPDRIRHVLDFSVGDTRPDLTLYLRISPEVSAQRQRGRQVAEATAPDRFERMGADFFQRVARGFESLAFAEPDRIRVIDATRSADEVEAEIWRWVGPLLEPAVQSRYGELK